jgi:hypothetical protein
VGTAPRASKIISLGGKFCGEQLWQARLTASRSIANIWTIADAIRKCQELRQPGVVDTDDETIHAASHLSSFSETVFDNFLAKVEDPFE